MYINHVSFLWVFHSFTQSLTLRRIISPVIDIYNQITPIWISKYLSISVPICPVIQIENGVASNCPTTDRWLVNSTMEYSCNPGYVSATTTTKCLKIHNWDPKPTCSPGNYLAICFIATYSHLQQWKRAKFILKPYKLYIYKYGICTYKSDLYHFKL